jgi:catechol 2,3-dioxygenase-like lactoylglutathione lyase family enzyme
VSAVSEKKSLSLPPVAQIGVVVRDLAGAIDYYSKVFGVGPFTTFDFVPEKHLLRGKPLPIKLRIGVAQMGAVQIELIQPVEGDAPHKWFLESKGEGLQHLGFIVDNYDEWMVHLKEEGIGVLMEAETTVQGMGHVRAAYMESDKVGGILFELVEVKP